MNKITGKNYDEERSLYGIENTIVENCTFSGPADGESPLKESKNIIVNDSMFNLRYPFWHTSNIKLNRISLTDVSRAGLWYSKKATITDSNIKGVKFLRECRDVEIDNSIFESPEFGWKSKNLSLKNSTIVSEYPFFYSSKIVLDNVNLKGKYSFQYVKDLYIENSNFDTKDAFWHSENVIVKDTYIKGEYIAWYAKDITFINCTIIGTQPFCYAKNVVLKDCVLEACDFAFEHTTIDATINSDIISIKNPESGNIVCKSVKDIMIDKFKRPGTVIINGKEYKNSITRDK